MVHLRLLLWECGSPAWRWCYLRCSALADRWPLGPPPPPPPPLWLVGSFPWPQVAPCSLWLGRSGGAWSRVLAKFKIKVLNFPQPPYFTFTFHTSCCCHHLALLPDHGMPPWDLLPPSAALYGEAKLVLVYPSQTLSLEQIDVHTIC